MDGSSDFETFSKKLNIMINKFYVLNKNYTFEQEKSNLKKEIKFFHFSSI